MKVLLNLSIQFLTTRDKILSIDRYVTQKMKSDAIFTFQLQHGRGEQSSSIQLFRQRLSYKRGEPFATMSKVIMGNGSFMVA